MTGRHDLPEIEAMLIAAEPAPTLQRRDCSWCSGTGWRPVWIGWTKVDDEPCCRCAGTGHIVVEDGCYD